MIIWSSTDFEMALLHCMVRQGSVRFTFGGVSTVYKYLVPGKPGNFFSSTSVEKSTKEITCVLSKRLPSHSTDSNHNTFIRRFYSKRLTFLISMCVPWESNPQPFALLTQCSTTEPHRNIMKCFERLVMHNIKTRLPNTLDPLQFAYCPNCSMDNAISSTLHLALTHLENKDSYVRMLFIDFSSAFNTIITQQFINKLNLLGLNNSLCNWILDFLTGSPQFAVSAATPRALPHWT